jgi:hypothetical protein
MAKPTWPSFRTCLKNNRSSHVAYVNIYLIGLFYLLDCIGINIKIYEKCPEKKSNKITKASTRYQEDTIKISTPIDKPNMRYLNKQIFNAIKHEKTR